MSFPAKEPFYFFTRQTLTYLTGRKAKNLAELLSGIKQVPTSSIYHHTHHYLEQHEFLSPEPPNDFAYWITDILQDKVLGEKVASIDLREFFTLQDIRSRIIEVIEHGMRRSPDDFQRNVPNGAEFHFMSAQTFVFATKYVAHSLIDFKECLEKVSIYSIYYHVFEARLRRKFSDFSVWLAASLGEDELAQQFMELDPYTQTLENLRRTLIGLIETRLMEGIHAKASRI